MRSQLAPDFIRGTELIVTTARDANRHYTQWDALKVPPDSGCRVRRQAQGGVNAPQGSMLMPCVHEGFPGA